EDVTSSKGRSGRVLLTITITYASGTQTITLPIPFHRRHVRHTKARHGHQHKQRKSINRHTVHAITGGGINLAKEKNGESVMKSGRPQPSSKRLPVTKHHAARVRLITSRSSAKISIMGAWDNNQPITIKVYPPNDFAFVPRNRFFTRHGRFRIS